MASAITSDMFTDDYSDVFAGDERGSLWSPRRRHLRLGRGLHLRAAPPYFDGMPQEPEPVEDIEGARVLLKLGDSVTTDHIRPRARSRRTRRPLRPARARRGAARLQLLRLAPRQPRDHDPRHLRQHRLRNQLAPGPRAVSTRDFSQGEGEDAPVTSVDEASEKLPGGRHAAGWCCRARSTAPARRATGRPRAPRCWASRLSSRSHYERIHRSNLIGMGVLPLQYPEGENAESLGLTGEETFSITGVTELNEGTTPAR